MEFSPQAIRGEKEKDRESFILWKFEGFNN